MSDYARENLLRLMAAGGWSVSHLVEQTGLAERTIRGILGKGRKPHIRTLQRLAQGLGVNVEEFSSEVGSAPMSGEPLFKANARLRLPPGCDLAALKKDLERIAADLLVDVSFAEVGNG